MTADRTSPDPGPSQAKPPLPPRGPELDELVGTFDWGQVRVLHSKMRTGGTFELAPDYHTVAVNVGPDFESQAPLGARGWTTFRFQHLAMAVLPAGGVYPVRHLGPQEIVSVDIAPGFVPEPLTGPDGRLRCHESIGRRSELGQHLVLALAEEARAGGPGGLLVAESLATALLAHLADAPSLAPAIVSTPALGSEKLRKVLGYIDAHLDAPLSLRTLAGLAGLDHFQFGRAFRRCTGESPHRYVMRTRIEHAKRLLANRALSVTEIAMATGFATPSHFALTFRRFAKVSPREFRDAL